MDIDEIRQETIELITRIGPKLQEGVFSPDQFRVHFETPYRARSIQKLVAYEQAHKKIFCRQCTTKHPTKQFLLCYQLWIEESDNLMENKPGEWVSAQCMNEECDFDLITPRPRPTQDALAKHEEMLKDLIHKYPQADVWNQQAIQGVLGRNMEAQRAQQQYEHAAYMREQAARQNITPNLGNYGLEALSSARTLGRKKK